jgi:hypothetical protein
MGRVSVTRGVVATSSIGASDMKKVEDGLIALWLRVGANAEEDADRTAKARASDFIMLAVGTKRLNVL